MTPRHHLNDPRLILWWSIFHDFSWFSPSVPSFGMIPTSSGNKVDTIWKSIKIIIIQIKNDSLGYDEPLIAWVKGVTGMPTGGTPSDCYGCRMSPGGENFAPNHNNPNQDLLIWLKIALDNFGQRGPQKHNRRNPSGQFGCRMSPGGECFAPLDRKACPV